MNAAEALEFFREADQTETRAALAILSQPQRLAGLITPAELSAQILASCEQKGQPPDSRLLARIFEFLPLDEAYDRLVSAVVGSSLSSAVHAVLQERWLPSELARIRSQGLENSSDRRHRLIALQMPLPADVALACAQELARLPEAQLRVGLEHLLATTEDPSLADRILSLLPTDSLPPALVHVVFSASSHPFR